MNAKEVNGYDLSVDWFIDWFVVTMNLTAV